jgi:hypothetical protein
MPQGHTALAQQVPMSGHAQGAGRAGDSAQNIVQPLGEAAGFNGDIAEAKPAPGTKHPHHLVYDGGIVREIAVALVPRPDARSAAQPPGGIPSSRPKRLVTASLPGWKVSPNIIRTRSDR